jgi:hypothetical protein
VMNKTFRACSGVQRLPEGIQHEIRSQQAPNAPADDPSVCCSSTGRTALSRNSGEYRIPLFMTQSAQRIEPPRNPGRFIPQLRSESGVDS